MKMFGLVLTLLVALSSMCKASSLAAQAPAACTQLTPTLTFSTECTDFNAHDAWCFYDNQNVSRVPTIDDVVIISNYGQPTMSFSYLYTPITVKALIVGSGVTLTMYGGAIEVTECLVIHPSATLNLAAQQVDTGAVSTVAFKADPSVPHGTDCSKVPQGFTPRICGPGVIVNSGTLAVSGLYASIFAATTVTTGGQVYFGFEYEWQPEPVACNEATCGPFLWGALTNYGNVEAAGDLFLHGSIANFNKTSLQRLRTDVWSTTPRVHTPVVITNSGELYFDHTMHNDSNARTNVQFLTPPIAGSTVQYQFKLLNNKGATVNYVCLDIISCNPQMWFAGNPISPGNGGVDIFNYGTMSWIAVSSPLVHGGWNFGSFGSFVNSGLITSSGVYVDLQDYLSQGGHMSTTNGGSFFLGNRAGVDTKTVVLCKKDKSKTKENGPVRANIGSFVSATEEVRIASGKHKKSHSVTNKRDVIQTNITCNFALYPYTGCADSSQCCGPTGVCESAQCCWYGGPNSLSGSFGTPGCEASCCPNNAGCFASSHGPYCGNEVFIWDVDTECFEGLKFVDRYDYEFMKKEFALVDLPQFGKYRYSFRGSSTITGDGTGSVSFTEPIEIDGELTVQEGGTLSSLIDSGNAPFVGTGRLAIGKNGHHVAGIRSAYTAQTNVVVEAGGEFVVPSFSTTMIHASANVNMKNQSLLLVEGRLVNMPDGSQNAHVCATVRGNGALIGETHCD